MTALTELAARCEAADASEQEKLLREAAKLILRDDAEIGQFVIRLGAEAFVDAAIMLVPEGWFIYACGEDVRPIIYKGDRHDHIGFFAEAQHREGGRLKKATGQVLSFALAAAALKARA